MRKLVIPEALMTEFATVEAIWNTASETRRVDALVLSWVKYEKQLRRLFSFFVFQHPNITEKTLDSVISAFAANWNLYPQGERKVGDTFSKQRFSEGIAGTREDNKKMRSRGGS